MMCPTCQREAGPEDRFCINCGALLVDQAEQPSDAPAYSGEEQGPAFEELGGDADIGERISALASDVNALRNDLSHYSDRLLLLERLISAPSIEPPGTRAAAPPVSPGPAPRPPAPTSAAQASAAPDSSRQAPVTPPLPPRPPGQPAFATATAGGAPPSGGGFGGGFIDTVAGWNWEWLVGGNWLARIGVVAMVIGVGFFLKLAFDNNWIGEIGRVSLGIGAGLALLGVGEYTNRKYPVWAQPVTGGGLAVLFLAIFAAFALYQLIPPLVAFGVFFLITVTAAALALRYESVAIAVLGIIGGFATPLLLSDRLPDQRLLLAYVLVLDVGVLILATFRNWRWFTLLALTGSLALFGFWWSELEPGLLLAQVGITLIFLIFVGATTLFHVLWRREAGPADLALMVINATAYFGISYALMFNPLRLWMGGFTVLLALFYVLLGYGALLRSREQLNLSLFALATGLVFLTIAVPVQLGGPWISVAWAVEGVALVWLSFNLKMPQLRWYGVAVFGVFAVWLVLIDTPGAYYASLSPSFDPILNPYLPAYALAIGLTFLAAFLFHWQRDALLPSEQYLFPAFLVAGNLFVTLGLFTQVEGRWIAVAWSAEALALMWLSFRLGLLELRLFSLGVLALVVARLLVFDTLNVDLRTFRPLLNDRFLAFAAGIAATYLSAALLWRWREESLAEWAAPIRMAAFPVLLGVASFLTLWLFSAEIITSVQSDFFDVPGRVADDVTSLSLSILWAVYAGVLISLGIVKRWRWVRLAGLGLLAVPVIKLFAFDVFALDQGYRVAAFLGLGVLMVAGGLLYQRYSQAIRGFLFE